MALLCATFIPYNAFKYWFISKFILKNQHYDGFVILSHWCSMWNVSTIWYPKKPFFADFSCILPICDYYHACFGGCLAETLLSKFLFTSLPWIFCFSSQPLSLGGNAFVKQHIYHFIFGFRGNLNRVRLLELYSPVAWWKPTNHSSLLFFRHGASWIQIRLLCSGQECSLLHINELT